MYLWPHVTISSWVTQYNKVPDGILYFILKHITYYIINYHIEFYMYINPLSINYHIQLHMYLNPLSYIGHIRSMSYDPIKKAILIRLAGTRFASCISDGPNLITEGATLWSNWSFCIIILSDLDPKIKSKLNNPCPRVPMGLGPWAKTCIYYLVPWGLWALGAQNEPQKIKKCCSKSDGSSGRAGGAVRRRPGGGGPGGGRGANVLKSANKWSHSSISAPGSPSCSGSGGGGASPCVSSTGNPSCSGSQCGGATPVRAKVEDFTNNYAQVCVCVFAFIVYTI